MKKNPTKVIPYIKRGLVYVADNQNDKALIEFETAVKIRPGSTSAHYQRGKILYKCGNYKDAIVDFNFCIKRNMFLPEMYRYRGLTRMKQNQPINALNDWFSAYCNKDTDSKILIKEYIKKLNLKEKLDYKNEPGLKR